MKKTWLIGLVAMALGAMAQAQEEMDFGAMMKALSGMAQEGGAAQPPAAVSPKALKELLPKAVPGYERVEAGAEKQGVMGMSSVVAKAVYENGAKTIEIEITDVSGLGPFGAMAMVGWAQQEVDKETRGGFERTGTCQGHKSLEKWDKNGQEAELDIYVSGRFSVKVSGSGLDSFDELQPAAKAIDFKALTDLKAEAQ